MNARILELIKTPEIIGFEDLNLLQSEIKLHPYVQIIRALQLFGINKLIPENYQQELSKTAAYTTDKKILYQFINGKKELFSELNQEQKQSKFSLKNIKLSTENQNFAETKDAEDFSKEEIVDTENSQDENLQKNVSFHEVETLIIDNQKADNQNFAEAKDAEDFSKERIVDSENSQDENLQKEVSFHEVETWSVDNQKADNQNFAEEKDAEDFSKEEIINEDKISEEEREIEKSSVLSFHGTENFLPEIKLNPNSSESKISETPKQNLNRHNDEMQKLIAEVEAKMRQNAKPKIEETENHANRDIDFVETHDIAEKIQKSSEIQEKEEDNLKIKEKAEVDNSETITKETPKEVWKPMNFASATPDSILGEKVEKTSISKENLPKIDEISSKSSEISEEKISENQDSNKEIPVINVSFFAENVSSIKTETPKISKESEKILEIEENKNPQSNVSNFINTWQSWLKLDRKNDEERSGLKSDNKEVASDFVEDKKSKAIENFIENEPKISKLKEDSEYVVKDKGDNISHLMTETLAKLYTEQKLYGKAIKAYETLMLKHPEKTGYFDQKIQEIKEIRSKN